MNDVIQSYEKMQSAQVELNKYKQLEQDGLLKIFPCKVGGVVYLLLERMNGDFDIITSKCVCHHERERFEYWSMYFQYEEIDNTLEYYADDFGKTVFLTKEAAEKALEGLQK